MSAYVVEAAFVHKGLPCIVVFIILGWRCGYVGVPKNHPWYGLGYTDEIEGKIPIEAIADVHGGLTYSGNNNSWSTAAAKEMGAAAIPVWWFGFDCGHYGDAGDVEALNKHFYGHPSVLPEHIQKTLWKNGEVRTLAFVQAECRKLAEQLIGIKAGTIEAKI